MKPGLDKTPPTSSSSPVSTSLLDSALASVSEMASRSHDFAKEKVVKSSKDSLSRAFSVTRAATIDRHSSAKNEPSVDHNSSSDWSEPITALNSLISPLTSAQKHKHNLFAKLESHSLSISSALFGGANKEAVFSNLENQDPFDDANVFDDMIANTSVESTVGSGPGGSLKRKSKPPGTVEYTVEENETLEKIALKWNTIPSEIHRLNRLVTRVIFPGQVLFVPDPNYVPPTISPPTSPPSKALPISIINEINTLETSSTSMLPLIDSPVSDANQSIHTPASASSGISSLFKWKNTTPQTRPGHVEKQMKQKSASQSDVESFNERPNKTLHSRHTLTEEEAKKLDQECMQRFLKINCKIVTRTKGCFQGVLIITPSALMFDPTENNPSSSTNGHKYPTLTHSTSIYDEANALIPIEIISNVIMYEDLALKDVQEYFDYQNNIEAADQLKTSDVCFELSSESKSLTDTESEKQPNNDGVRSEANLVQSNINGEPSFGDLSISSNTISCYLCIKVNKNKDYITCPLNRKMKNRLSSEFWFQINDNSTDKICAFFLEWKSDPTSEADLSQGGHFRLVKQDEKLNDLISDTLASDAILKSSASTNRLIHKNIGSFIKDWEIVNLKEYEQKLRKEIEIEKEYNQLPTLIGQSTILEEDHLRKLNVNLIPRAVGYSWMLTFSTDLNGFSLNTMYRLLADVDGPCLVVVMDTQRNIFGAMSPCKLYQSEHYYGTGECFLFTFYPSFRIFKWTGENNFFIRGNAESIGFGCAEGYHGLWFDGDLLNGHTQRSKTFDNDMLTSSEYFTIAAIEVWTFSD